MEIYKFENDNILEGKVKWFNNVRGFGFIETGDGDFFVHYSDIEGEGDGAAGFKTLKPGSRVTFYPAYGTEGRTKAVNVRIIQN